MNNLEEFLAANQGKKIVFTNGCFDILHRGHVSYLEEAKKLGDLLIVGVNSDSSVRGLKGPERPINNQDDRRYILNQLQSVDWVEIFSESTPLNLIKKIKPQVLVKGGDWSEQEIVGSTEVKSWGGEVKSIHYVPGYSTTSTISQIRTVK